MKERIDGSINETYPPSVADIAERSVINGILYLTVDTEADLNNPFVSNEYDYDSGFYNGEFNFEDVITGEIVRDTPEGYGRRRIAKLVAEVATTRYHTDLLDLGCGTLDLCRTLPPALRPNIGIINSDISGPWSSKNDSMTRGAAKLYQVDSTPFNYIANIQYDFNAAGWPFSNTEFDIVASNMALHHVKPANKEYVMRSIYSSLRPGGIFILNDVYEKNARKNMVTSAGARGPSECKGYPLPFASVLALAKSTGFKLDGIASKAAEDELSITDDDINHALDEPAATLPISNSVWFTSFRKDDE